MFSQKLLQQSPFLKHFILVYPKSYHCSSFSAYPSFFQSLVASGWWCLWKEDEFFLHPFSNILFLISPWPGLDIKRFSSLFKSWWTLPPRTVNIRVVPGCLFCVHDTRKLVSICGQHETCVADISLNSVSMSHERGYGVQLAHCSGPQKTSFVLMEGPECFQKRAP